MRWGEGGGIWESTGQNSHHVLILCNLRLSSTAGRKGFVRCVVMGFEARGGEVRRFITPPPEVTLG